MRSTNYVSSAFQHHIWVDALSIWQENVPERNTQVNMMGEIYGNAAKVVIWLGKDNSDTPSVVRLLSQLAAVPNEKIEALENNQQYGGQPGNPDQDSLLEQLGLPYSDVSLWLALMSFLQRSYFTRMWILQEVALARDTEVLCGNFNIPSGDLWDASMVLMRTNLSRDLSELEKQTSASRGEVRQPGATITAINLIRVFCQSGPTQMSENFAFLNRSKNDVPDVITLFNMISFLTRGYKASEPKDKIFALIGVLDRFTQRQQLRPFPIIADYSRTTAEVFLKATSLILQSTRWLALLAFVPGPSTRTVPELPTWVPDFTAQAQSSLAIVPRIKDTSRFDASRCLSSTDISFRIDERKLHVKGIYVDTVSDLGETTTDIVDLCQFEDSARLILECNMTYRTNQDRIEVLWRTLISNQTTDQYPAPADIAHSFQAWLKFILMKGLNGAMMTGQDVGEYIRTRPSADLLAQSDSTGIMSGYAIVTDEVIANATPGIDPSLEYRSRLERLLIPFQAAFSSVAPLRRLFRTASGWIGLGPKSLAIGDSVWILSDAPTPFALRESAAGHYALVGEAYVHGAMHGEAMGSEEPEWERIVLG